MNKINTASKRLMKEYTAYYKEVQQQIQQHGRITDNFIASPDPMNIQNWYFIIFGLVEPAYKDGYYMGCIYFPDEYPFKAPEIRMLVDTGRFKTNSSICLSITHHHQESWNPYWSSTTIIPGLMSMMNQQQVYFLNFINSSFDTLRLYARKSKESTMKHPMYDSLFKHHA